MKTIKQNKTLLVVLLFAFVAASVFFSLDRGQATGPPGSPIGDAPVGSTPIASLTASKPVFTDASKILTSSGTVPVDQGGTGATTLTDHGILLGSGATAITPMAALSTGEIVYGLTGADPAVLGAQTAASRKFLHQTGTGAAGQAPTWEAIISGDLTTALTTPPAIGGTTPADGTFTDVMLTAATELTISAGGSVTATQSVHKIDTAADGVTDDLDTISGGQNEQLLLLRAENAARTVVVKHNTGNILLGGSDVTLDDTNKYLLLMYDSGLSKWLAAGDGGGSVDLTAPGPIGSVTPNTGAFTTLTNSGKQVETITLNAASGNEVAHQLNYTVNKVAGNDTGLEINMTDALSPGTSYPLSINVGGSSKAYVTNAGQVGGISFNVNDGSLFLELLAGAYPAVRSSSATGLWLALGNANLTGNSAFIFSKNTSSKFVGTNKEQSWLLADPVINQSGTAAYNGLKIDVTETTLGDGSTGDGNNLIRVAVGGATKFKVSNAGSVTATGNLSIAGGNFRGRTDAGAADYNPSILTDDYLITADNTAAARAITLSTEDVASGTAAIPRFFIVKDEYSDATAHPLTVTVEGGGTVDGGASAIISTDDGAISLYCYGTTCFIH